MKRIILDRIYYIVHVQYKYTYIPDEVIVAIAALLDKQLRVEQSESTEEQKAAVQRNVVQEVRSDEQIEESEQHEQRETAREHSFGQQSNQIISDDGL